MKRRIGFVTAFALYIALMMALMRFDIAIMIQPMPLASVLAGIVILTLFQYKKASSLVSMLKYARSNALFSGAFVSLLALLSSMSEGAVDARLLMRKLIPAIYGGIASMLFHLAVSFTKRETDNSAAHIFDAQTAIPVFKEKGFSERESHVALKLLEGLPNMKIANQLYISESTVKKHIQNLFRKCGAANRHDFVNLYTDWVKQRQESR